MSVKNGVVVLRKGRERSPALGHPWLLSGSVARVEGDPAAGDVVELRDESGAVVWSGGHNSSIPSSSFSGWTRSNAGDVLVSTFAQEPRLEKFLPNGSLSFLGAVATAGERIARVRITTGNSALGPADANGNAIDVVAMDDFLYSEPIAIPEPASCVLAAMALIGGMLIGRRR